MGLMAIRIVDGYAIYWIDEGPQSGPYFFGPFGIKEVNRLRSNHNRNGPLGAITHDQMAIATQTLIELGGA